MSGRHWRPLADVVLEGGPVLEGLNDRIRRIAAANGVLVADTYGLLGPGELVGGTDCLHPNDAGHQKIAEAFAAALAGTGAGRGIGPDYCRYGGRLRTWPVKWAAAASGVTSTRT